MTTLSITDLYCETRSGRFYINDPVFNIEDIAHSLSRLCRYNGHCDGFYSVAEHSILVAWLLGEWDQPVDVVMQGLLHDATEAYLSDVPAPFKQLLPDWKRLEHTLETQLYTDFNLGEKSPMVKKADWYALFIEANQMLPSKGEGWHDPLGVREDAIKIKPPINLGSLDISNVENSFLWNYDRLAELRRQTNV